MDRREGGFGAIQSRPTHRQHTESKSWLLCGGCATCRGGPEDCYYSLNRTGYRGE